jgi:hypothetical protein
MALQHSFPNEALSAGAMPLIEFGSAANAF